MGLMVRKSSLHLAALIALVFSFTPLCLGNVEKLIFLGPARPAALLQDDQAAYAALYKRLSPTARLDPSKNCTIEGRNCRKIETTLSTSFAGLGEPHWVVMDNLVEDQRYEVRICWPATQPTDFTLEAFNPAQLMGDRNLVESLNSVSSEAPTDASYSKSEIGQYSPVLFLRIQAKTAYFSFVKSRMENPEPVDVDIILDPFLLNLLPESLGPISIWICTVAVLAWWISGAVYKLLCAVVDSALQEEAPKAETKKSQ